MTTTPETPRRRSLASPEDQKVTWIELFFDLVFVFSVTQVVGVLHDGIDLVHAGQSLLVFWLVWWAWTQFTWALNAADTTHPFVELSTMAATAVAFFMAVTLPDAFAGAALGFALPYVIVRSLGLAIYARVARQDPGQHAAVRRFAAASSFGLIAVLAGAFAGGDAQYWLWAGAIALDVIAAIVGARSNDWNLHAEHFAERHGLFVIITLGETVIIAASRMTGTQWTADHVAVGVLGVAVTCALWWTYFTRAKPALDHAIESVQAGDRSMMARDAFSLLHFPMVCGIVAYAAALDEALAHPAEPMTTPARVALAAALLLFVGGMSLALRRADVRWPLFRAVVVLAAAAALLTLPGLDPVLALLITFAAVFAVALREERLERHVEHGEHAHENHPMPADSQQARATDPDDAIPIR